MLPDTIFDNYSIGLNRLFSELKRDSVSNQNFNYPPYNILQLEEYKTLLELAVAGFKREELTVEFKEDVLSITGERKGYDNGVEFRHKGISNRNFKRNFVLSPDVKINSVKLADGMLSILLEREIPEHKKARTIPIQTDESPDVGDGVDDDKLLLMEKNEGSDTS